MTGWYPHVRGHRSLWHPLQKDEPNLLKSLKNAGYEVLWGGKNDLLAPDAFAESAPQPWHDLYDPQAVPALRPPGFAGKPEFHEMIRRSRRLDELDDAFFRRINAVYGGRIGVVDTLLGQLLDALDQSGLADETTVMAFSDHGDWAGDYGLVEKWSNALDDTLTRVPLVMRAPGGKSGHVVEEPVELFDIMATTLELAGIEAQHTHFSRSLTAQLGGAAGDAGRTVFAEGGYALHEPRIFEGDPRRDAHLAKPSNVYYPKMLLQREHPERIGRSVMVRTQTHKLIHRPAGQSELYDLKNDPQELHNRHGQAQFSAIQRALEAQLLDWMVQTSDVTPHHEDPRGFPPML